MAEKAQYVSNPNKSDSQMKGDTKTFRFYQKH